MKKLIALSLLLLSLAAQSQYSLRLMQYRPTGDLGGVMKKSFSGEFLYINDHNDMDGVIRTRLGVGFVKMSPRLDTFPFVSYEYSNGVTKVYPGFLVYNKFSYAYLSAGMDYIKETDKKLKFYPGADLLVGIFMYDYESSSHFMHLTTSDGYNSAGMRLRAGMLYELSDKMNLHFEANRSYYYVDQVGFWSANDLGFTLQLIF